MFQSILIIALMTFSFLTQAALPADPIQRCLDIRRLADITSRQKMAAKEPGVLRFKFHKISASELPLDNPVGNMDEVIQALNNQIENCNNSYGEFQTVTIASHQFKRQEWCLNTNKKMLTLAKAAHGDFKNFYRASKPSLTGIKAMAGRKTTQDLKKVSFNLLPITPQPLLRPALSVVEHFCILSIATPGLLALRWKVKNII